jgi:hypothetical protein
MFISGKGRNGTTAQGVIFNTPSYLKIQFLCFELSVSYKSKELF